MKSADLVEVLKFEQTPYWIISTKAQRAANGSARMFANIPEDDSFSDNVDLSIEKLEKVLNWLAPGKYVIKYYKDEKNKSKGFFEQEFTHGDLSASSGRIAGDPMGYPGSIGAVEKMVAEKVDAMLKAKELEELKAEVEELRKSQEDPAGWKSAIGNVLNSINEQAPALLPVMAQEVLGMIKGIFGQTRLAGPPVEPPAPRTNIYQPKQQTEQMSNHEQNNDELLKEVEQELENLNEDYAQVIFRLRLLDPDLLTTLQKMATKAEQNPAMITMLKTML